MNVLCSVSLGELVDKISILRIKLIKIDDAEKLKFVNSELSALSTTLEGLKLSNMDSFMQRLIDVNSKLWDIEDLIRDKERDKSFDSEFVELARSVYVTNDQRFKIKNEINESYGSDYFEVKSYKKY